MATIDDFKKLDIRIGRIKSAEKVEGADKLLKLVLDLGGEERQILSGIAEYYEDVESLVGKEVPVITNLEPRTIRGHESQGMVIMAIAEGGRPVLMHPTENVPPGSEVR